MRQIDKNIVLLCDVRKTDAPVTIYSNDLEFSADIYAQTIKQSLENIAKKVYIYDNPKDFIDNISKHKNDIVFSAIWSGTDSRNRKSIIPSICEAYRIQYIGGDPWVSSMCQDKALSKLYCKAFNIKVPEGILIDNLNQTELLKTLKYPVIIKPNAEGSSIGISDDSLAYNYQECIEKIQKIFSLYAPILVEEYIDGIEVAACISGDNYNINLFEVVQLIINGKEYFDKEIWGFQSKIGQKAKITRKIITDKVPKEICDELKKIYLSLKKVDYMRIDGRIKDGKFYLIELTPDCSLHPRCFMSTSFTAKDYTYQQMIYSFIENSISYYSKKK